jgi:hypothetical protein
MTRTQPTSGHPAGQDRKDPQVAAPDHPATRASARGRPSVTWNRSGSGFSATIDGRDYRVTKYPPGSALDAPYGAYAEGRFIGSGPTLDNVKSRCSGHAARLRFRSPADPEPEPSSEQDSC